MYRNSGDVAISFAYIFVWLATLANAAVASHTHTVVFLLLHAS